MTGRRKLLPCTLAALLVSLCAGAFAAGKFDDVRSVLGEPPPGATTWILVTNPPKRKLPKGVDGFAGLQLHASRVVEVIPEFNPTSHASGHIAEPDRCPCQHYHGELFGYRDPDKNKCGWGCVIPFDDAPQSVGFLSAAVTREERAIIKARAGDLPGAVTDLVGGADDVQHALDNEPLPGDGGWDEEDSQRFRNALEAALDFDALAQDDLSAAQKEQDPSNKKKKTKRATGDIDHALDAKRAALKRVVDVLDLAGSDD